MSTIQLGDPTIPVRNESHALTLGQRDGGARTIGNAAPTAVAVATSPMLALRVA